MTVIYTLEPVAAALFAYILLGERLEGVGALAGSVLILLAVVLNVYKKRNTIEYAGIKSTLETRLPKMFSMKSN